MRKNNISISDNRENIAVIKTNMQWIKDTLNNIQKQVEEHNDKLDEVCINLKNHLRHHEDAEKNRKWFYGFVVAIAGIVAAGVNVILTIVGV
jgi:seryl-tRNA synthetase